MKRNRRSTRLQEYDYTGNGAYFITVCTHNRVCLFGEVSDDRMVLNDAGEVAAACWREIPDHFALVELDEWVVMPNHVHGIIMIDGGDTGTGAARATHASPLRPYGARPAGRGPNPWARWLVPLNPRLPGD